MRADADNPPVLLPRSAWRVNAYREAAEVVETRTFVVPGGEALPSSSRWCGERSLNLPTKLHPVAAGRDRRSPCVPTEWRLAPNSRHQRPLNTPIAGRGRSLIASSHRSPTRRAPAFENPSGRIALIEAGRRQAGSRSSASPSIAVSRAFSFAARDVPGRA